MKESIQKKYWNIILIILPLIAAIMCFAAMLLRNEQALLSSPILFGVSGEYSYDGETWLPLEDDSSISALDGNLLVRGHLTENVGEGARLNYYRNHIGVSVYANGELVFMDAQTDVGIFGSELTDSMCGSEWNWFVSPGITTEDVIEIHLINYHKYGNKNAYREFLNTLCITPDSDIILEGRLRACTKPFQITGYSVLIVSLMILGAAAASAILKNEVGDKLFKYGLLSFFAGGYIIFDTIAVFSQMELVAVKTYGRQLCMLLFVYFLGLLIKDSLKGKMQKIVQLAMILSMVWNSILILLAFAGKMLIFDTQPYWVASQWILCPMLIVCCLLEVRQSEKKDRYYLISFVVLLTAILLDLSGVGAGMYSQGTCAKIVFVLLLICHLIKAAKLIILDHRASVRAEKLEEELAEKRIAIMLSQIQPHFIYNTLGTIGQFCLEDPKKAADLVQKFSLYLRGNFTELDNAAPIRLSQEMEHVQHYVNIEQIRFPDMQIVYDLKSGEFLLPALTVQPLVENAIKHGLMGLETGGTVIISTYETDKDYCVCVKDNGVGFEEAVFQDGKKHIGIKNIRGRIEAMCGGTLTIESTPGEGTTALITIPKETS